MTQTRAVLELWREAERAMQELGPKLNPDDRDALEFEIEALRDLYQRVQEMQGHDAQTDAAHPGMTTDGWSASVAVEHARQRLQHLLGRSRDVDGVLGVSSDIRLAR